VMAVFGIQIDQGHGGAEDHLVPRGHFGDVDDLSMAQLRFDLLNAALDKALLLAGCVILGIFLEITMGTSLGNRRDDARPLDLLQLLQLGAQAIGAGHGHGYLVHDLPPACSSCRLRASWAGPWARAMHTARPPANVVV